MYTALCVCVCLYIPRVHANERTHECTHTYIYINTHTHTHTPCCRSLGMQSRSLPSCATEPLWQPSSGALWARVFTGKVSWSLVTISSFQSATGVLAWAPTSSHRGLGDQTLARKPTLFLLLLLSFKIHAVKLAVADSICLGLLELSEPYEF